jgi:23S rRNA (cytosine1962-C5)-methyltransferase
MNKKTDFIIEDTEGYELIDSGEGEKLERFGDFVLRRPDPQALWSKNLETEWENADASFETNEKGGKWQTKDVPEKWTAKIGDVTFELSRSTFKHVGVFPEQAPNWNWISDKIKKADRPIKVLNLFGYTGGATIAASLAGSEVVHVDGSKTAITQANKNAELSGADSNPIRWIPEDARKFVEREIKRGSKYDAIIMDPPAFGHGAKGERWIIEKDLVSLIALTKKILTPDPLFYILNGYAAGYSSIGYAQMIDWLIEKHDGEIEHGELLFKEKDRDRFLPAGITARWSK